VKGLIATQIAIVGHELNKPRYRHTMKFKAAAKRNKIILL
jgi:hypothetical protein